MTTTAPMGSGCRGIEVTVKPMKSAKYIEAPPISPGQVLKRRILKNDITQEELALAMRVSRISINQIINGRRSITADMALRLARVTGTTPFFWLNLQRDVDLYEAKRKLGKDIQRLTILRRPPTEAELFAEAQEA